MARENQARPPLRDALGKWEATRAEALIGIKIQGIPDGSTGGLDVVCDPEANLHGSGEATDPFTFTGLDLTNEAVPLTERTFKRAPGTTQVVTITLAQQIDGNTSYTLDAAGSGLTIQPVILPDFIGWLVKSAVGAVTAVP